ncbi:hypothetical protein M501DRAFT_1032480 [Patellaria atrata CBS 101060]|uniref:Uncharacterized protein n=1 Tax=Patellaria atrata CBS 101060 TaxID=1346257 RepID=A0A9P4S9T2_9PEZI|nr:hypothetical protein M501DRAFT_1032480 [Patellaria atrata CBS 101060]
MDWAHQTGFHSFSQYQDQNLERLARDYEENVSKTLKPLSVKIVSPYVTGLRAKIVDLNSKISQLSSEKGALVDELQKQRDAVLYDHNQMAIKIMQSRAKVQPDVSPRQNGQRPPPLGQALAELIYGYEMLRKELDAMRQRNHELEEQSLQRQWADHADTMVAAPGQTVKAEDLYSLRNLIRSKYALDIEIWSLRDVHARNQYIVDEKKMKSEAALMEIRQALDVWGNEDSGWTDEELPFVEEIYRRLMSIPLGQYKQPARRSR